MLIGLVMLASGMQAQARCNVGPGPLGCTNRMEKNRDHGKPRPRPRPLAGPREPSGAVALPTLGGLLVVDDEPKASPSWGVHFLRVVEKRLVSLPVRLPPGQRRSWDDLEGVTATADHVYLLGSHAHRDAQRSQLCRFPINTTRASPTHLVILGPIRCWGGHDQRRRIQQVLQSAATGHSFRLPKRYRTRHPKKGGLNLEGIHYDTTQKRFWLGLRSPLAEVEGKRYAILLTARLSQNGLDLSFGGLVDLQGRGIRALAPGPEQSMLISAGGVGKGGTFDLYRLNAVPTPPFRLSKPKRVTPPALDQAPPWFHPEALALYGDRLYIFSDSGQWPDAPAHYLSVPAP